jgi:ketosteroid isomerase-like protein
MPSNADTVRAIWAAYQRDGLPALLAHTDPEMAWLPARPGGRALHGHAELRAFFGRMRDKGVALHARADSVEEVRDAVLVRGSLRVEREGAMRESTMVWAFRVRDGRVRESRVFRSGAEARAALA